MGYRIQDSGPYKQSSKALLEAFVATKSRCNHTCVRVAKETGLLVSTVTNLQHYKTYRYDFSHQTMFKVRDYVEKYKEDAKPVQEDGLRKEPTVDSIKLLREAIGMLWLEGFQVSVNITMKD